MGKKQLFHNPLSMFSLFFLGRIFINIWLDLAYYDMFSSIEPLETQIGNITRGVLTVIVGLIILRSKAIPEKLISNLVVTSVVLLTIASGCMVVFFESSWPIESSSFLVQFSYIISEIGIIIPQAIWIKIYVRLRPSHAIAALLLSSGISAVICLFITPIPRVYTSVIFLFLPVLSHICYLSSKKKLADAPEKYSNKPPLPYDAEPQGTFLKLLIILICISSALGLALGYSSGETKIFSIEFTSFHQALVAIIAFAILLVMFYRRRMISLYLFCALVATLMVIGLSIFLIPTSISSQLGSSFIITARTLLLCLIWIVIYDTSRHISKNALAVFMVPYGVYLIFHFAARMVSAWIVELDYGETLLLISAASLMSFAFILLFSNPSPIAKNFLAQPTQPETAHTKSISPIDIESSPHSQNAQVITQTLVTDYNLSERESEIAVMVSKGRSRPYIANELHLSENTVRNYTRKVYQKMDVSSKQELIDLFEHIKQVRMDS